MDCPCTTPPTLLCEVQRHQDLPERAFVRHEDLLKEGMEIVAISYCWCSKEHPDPDRSQLSTKFCRAIWAVQRIVRLESLFPVGGIQ
eukprot:6034346-Amphidinium_carterae.1